MGVADFARDFVMSGVDLLMDDGIAYTVTLRDDGRGGYRQDKDELPIRGRVDSVLEWMRQENGYTEDNVGLFILQQDDLVLKKDDLVRLDQLYVIESIRQDPLKCVWECRSKVHHG